MLGISVKLNFPVRVTAPTIICHYIERCIKEERKRIKKNIGEPN